MKFPYLEEEVNKMSEYAIERLTELLERRKFELTKENEICHAKTLLRIAESKTFEESKTEINTDEFFDYTHR